MYRAIKVEALDNYRLAVEFEDGKRGEINLSDRLFGPMFEPLQDTSLFNQVRIDEFGAICWPNNADLAPDAVWKEI